MKSNQELIDIIVNYLSVNKLASQQDLRKLTNSSVKRMKELADAGHFVYPKKIPLNKRALLSDQANWRRFTLTNVVRSKNLINRHHLNFEK